MARKTFLICGIFSSILYMALNIYIPTLWPEYSAASQTVSELSAVDSPTRMLWIWLCTPYTILVIAFAWGVWISADQNHNLRITGGLLIAYGLLGVFWPFAPMHLRETLAAGGATFSDTMHIALGVTTEILFLSALAFAARALGKHFRYYSIITFVILLFFGVLTFKEAPDVGKNLPTPFIGIWERVNIGVFLVWVIVLASTLLRRDVSDAGSYRLGKSG
ncbi:MAG TPA: DUF998 domain-containing protein [Puia sp.]|nr:DUF998 domain-containing protein [Puia sp.]